MFKKTTEEKVLRDPVHGYIHVDLQVVWDVINSSWFQRLRRIRQLGGAYVVYHCAEHSRFGHSLGVYELVRRMVSEVQDISNALNEREKVTAILRGFYMTLVMAHILMRLKVLRKQAMKSLRAESLKKIQKLQEFLKIVVKD